MLRVGRAHRCLNANDMVGTAHPTMKQSEYFVLSESDPQLESCRQRIDEIDRKLVELKGLRATLAELARACHGDERPDCPILDDLSGHADQ